MHVVDKDKFNWMGFHELLGEEIVHGVDQELQVTFFDKTKDETVRIDSDSALLHAFDMYWDSREVPLTVHVVEDKVLEAIAIFYRPLLPLACLRRACTPA
jgi:hypothetical protein